MQLGRGTVILTVLLIFLWIGCAVLSYVRKLEDRK